MMEKPTGRVFGTDRLSAAGRKRGICFRVGQNSPFSLLSDRNLAAYGRVIIGNKMSFEFLRHRRVALLAVAVFPLLLHGQSAASTIPPGNSAADQYTEAYPGPTGNEQPDANSDSNPQASLPNKTSRDFERNGPIGEAALALAISTAPKEGANRDDRGPGTRVDERKGGRSEAPGRERAAGANANLEVAEQAIGVSGYAGVGYALPIFLFLVTLLAIVYVISRRRVSR